jgi:hypothetical protein
MSINGLDKLPEAMDWFIKFLPLLLPMILLELGLMIFAIVDIARKRKTKNLSPLIWIIIILFVNTLGSIIYLIFGRAEAEVKDDDDI